MLAAMAQMQRNVEFFLAHYLRAVTGYRPDIATFVIGSTQVVVFPGDHGGFSIHPDSFAAMLHKVLVAG
jgi:hypothetical protein